MRVALIGAAGQLGTALSQTLTDEVIPLGHDAVDVANPASVEKALAEAAPQAVVNCAAYNFVDKAEDEPQAAYLVNALGPRNLAVSCAKLGVPLLHVSSDYVFGGAGMRQGGRGYT